MGIAGGEKSVRLREVRIVLDRQEQLWQGLVEALMQSDEAERLASLEEGEE